ncbi:immunoglobulin-like domain-containing protein [Paenibacillus sp. DCT19]|uniref:immunoglobulin-like domain-containing protein n=1 Tax=Paenibacillus sp. DCT19 TaxID=2211212 RepID=UPI000FE23E27|nr:immunoglobulin-like domain-containing protein [Paenibacillus sp. DCT19]
MRNTSDPIKENSNVMNTQGGEKKVMKKILSVALSTAMAFSMFASVAFGDTAVSPQQKFDALKAKGIFSGYPDGTAGLEKDMTRAEFAKVITKLLGLKEITGTLSYTDQNYTAKNWAVPYIEAVTAAGIMEGKNVEKKIFDFNGKVTVSEMATILTRALDLEIPAETNNSAPEWAKGYVQAAINAGFLDANANFTANASRELLVGAAYVIDEAQNLKVSSYEVSEAGKVVTFKISDGESVKVTLDKALEANKETEVKFTYKDKEFTEKVTYVVTTATKVQSAAATNLKEVVVQFDGKVDKDSAENVVNYTLRSGKVIDTATLSDDQASVTLLLKDSALTNNRADAVTVANVKAGTATISATNVEFTAVDNVLPEVKEVKSLGTKSVKVVFSEPVKNVGQANFTLDGKEYFGKVTVSNNYRTVVLTPYSTTALAVGEHKLGVSGVKDYADFVSLASTHDITVVEDTTAPTITEATATLETVTVTFSEDVDVETVDAAKVYWKSGSDKITAISKKQLADNKWQFTFGVDKSLPTGSVSIFVEGVKDYSGNQIAADTSVVVTPVIDQVRPEVASVIAEDARTIKVTFSKEVNEASAETNANYTVKDKDGKSITVREAVRDNLDSKVVRVYLYTDLSVGDNAFTIQNVKDNTKLQNTILDYTGKVNLADKTAPAIDTKTVNTAERRVVITFDKKMDAESLANYSNYLVSIDDKFQPLTSSIAEITPFQDGLAVSIKFAESLNGKTVRLASGTGTTTTTNINTLTILGVKSTAGNVLKEFTQGGTANQVPVTADTVVALDGKAELVDRRTVKIKFTSGINNYSTGAFYNDRTNAPSVSNVEVDGTSTVRVKFNSDLATDASDLNLKINLSQLVTTAGNAPATGTITVSTATGVANVKDSVKPVALKPSADVNVYPFPKVGTNNNQFKISFSENVTAASPELAAGDFQVIRDFDNKELIATKGEFEIILNSDHTVTVAVNDADTRSSETAYRVIVKNAKALVDAAGNTVADFDGISVKLAGAVAPTGLTTENAAFATASQGKIKGLDTTKSYEYKAVGAPSYSSVAAGSSEIVVDPGTYLVRFAAGTGTASAATEVTVSKNAATDTEAVAAAKAALTLEVPTAQAGAANATITLPATGENGTNITWVVDGAIVSGGSYTTPARPTGGAPDVTKTITANITKGNITDVKTFTVTVPEIDDIEVN